MVRHIFSNQLIGWRYSDSELLDPITNVNDYYIFGSNEFSWGQYPRFVWDHFPVRLGDSLDPNINVPKSKMPSAQPSYQLINGLHFFRLYGESSSAGGVHTITPKAVDTAQTFFVVRYETGNDGENIRKTMVGCRTVQAGLIMDFSQQTPRATTTEVILGQDIIAPTDTARHVPIAPSSEEKTYRKTTTNFIFTWDGVDFAPFIRAFSFIGASSDEQIRINGATKPSEIRQGDFTHGVSFEIQRNTGTDVFVDTLNQEAAQKAIVFKIVNDIVADTYIQITITDLLGNVTMNHAVDSDKIFYRFEGIARTVSIAVKDGVADSFYKD